AGRTGFAYRCRFLPISASGSRCGRGAVHGVRGGAVFPHQLCDLAGPAADGIGTHRTGGGSIGLSHIPPAAGSPAAGSPAAGGFSQQLSQGEKSIMLRILSIAAFTAATLAAAAPAAAQDKWPSRPITIVGGFPNGSGVDLYARKLGQGLTGTLGVPIVVEARTGAGGNVASDVVSRAQPDGYTFLFGTAGTHAINAA